VLNDDQASPDGGAFGKRAVWRSSRHPLPFRDLSDEQFEVFNYVLVVKEHPNDEVTRYGGPGDRGCDVVRKLADGTHELIQCKRYSTNVNVGEILDELAKLCVNAFNNRLPPEASRVVFHVVPNLTSPAIHLLRSRDEWLRRCKDALKKYLGHEPDSELVAFARDWWPELSHQDQHMLSERARRFPDLIDQFFEVSPVITGSLKDIKPRLLIAGAASAIAALVGLVYLGWRLAGERSARQKDAHHQVEHSTKQTAAIDSITKTLEDDVRFHVVQVQQVQAENDFIRSLVPRTDRVRTDTLDLPRDADRYLFALQAIKARRLDDARKFLDQAEAEKTATPAYKILQARGRVETYAGHFAEALTWFKKAEAAAPDDPGVIEELGLVMISSASDRARGLARLQKALDLRKATNPSDKAEIARSYAYLGEAMLLEGDTSGAGPMLQRARELFEEDKSESDEYAALLDDLGGLEIMQGNIKGAKNYYDKALALVRKLYGPEHPDVAKELVNISSCEFNSEDPLAGTASLLEAKRIVDKSVITGHPDQCVLLVNLAALSAAADDHKQAIDLYDRAIAAVEKSLGKDSPMLVLPLTAKAAFFMEHQHAGESKDLLQRSLDILVKEYGEDHALVAPARLDLAACLRMQNELAAAEPLYTAALKTLEKPGAMRQERARGTVGLGLLRMQLGQNASAESLLKKALEMADGREGEEPICMEALNGLVQICFSAKQYNRSEELLERKIKLIQKLTKHEGKALEATEWTSLSWVQLLQKKLVPAQTSALKAIELLTKAVGPNDAALIIPLGNLVFAYALEEKFAEAAKYQTMKADLYVRLETPAGPDVASAKKLLEVMVNEQNRKYAEAERAAAEVVGGFSGQYLGQPAHGFILEIHARILRKLNRPEADAEAAKAKEIYQSNGVQY
jgi:tetratricopeptide (TPR) repeat protein